MTTQPRTLTEAEHRASQRRNALAATLAHLRQRALAYVFVCLWTFFTIFTVLWVIMTSFKTSRELFRDVWALPTELQWANYEKAWSVVHMDRYFFNSVLVVSASVVLILLLSAPASYALSRFEFRGRTC
ncbi:MAG: hypothetical protein M5R40_18840 [Anaerolineae bacterium]|nr:hypothetical protein [Anaerolineae bacterium]